MGQIEHAVAGFLRSEDGAVTVDWVVLTAAVVGLGLVIGPTVGQNTVGLSQDIAAEVPTGVLTYVAEGGTEDGPGNEESGGGDANEGGG